MRHVVRTVVLAALASSSLRAAERSPELALALGLRGGATFDVSSSGAGRAEADPAASWGLSYGWWVRDDGWFEVLFDRQTLDFEPRGGAAIEPFDFSIDYLQFGGGYEPRRDGLRPYVTAAVGLSRYGADPGSVTESTGLSGSIGAGFKIPMGSRALFRLEGRGFAGFTSGSAAVLCGSGCSIAFGGEGFWQLGIRAVVAYCPGGSH